MKNSSSLLLSWSGGKDSLLALDTLLKESHVPLLFTTFNQFGKIAIHGVEIGLIEKQAEALGLDLIKVEIPKNATNNEYEEKLSVALSELSFIDSIAFGDLFLEDIRTYRENFFSKISIKTLFPLWKSDPKSLLEYFIQSGFKAVVTSVNQSFLDQSWVGVELDSQFFQKLPEGIDLCGENGEYHTFVYDGPVFKNRIEFQKGAISLEDNHYMCQLFNM
ncbi:MAG: diphthine--ammonia ligase [Blastocatellia bacterium]|nr:diphthine--ammonia ligase [Blastocatellia bacterium]